MKQEISTITLALAAGAALALRPNRLSIPVVERPLYNAYDALEAVIRERYPDVAVDSLDIAPASAARQQELDDQLRRHGALDDPDVQAAAVTLLAEVAEHAPEAMAALQSATSAA